MCCREEDVRPGSGLSGGSDGPFAQRRRVEGREHKGEERGRRPRLEGLYESVCNATWSHVVGFPEGEGGNMVVRMKVREGQRPQELLWEYTQTVCTFLPVGGEEQFRPPPPRLMILSSEKQ
ncbi:retrotransposon hot spot (RHS) protein [Trypanosoma rangeli]|uniref:Retrotransposon hot spot (RHS) protein n=1 Tax=Trypanosoma rangeli TaxID=5698 RepID=A0A3R7KB89_TRYRA|nr:retrotransposon hot spot (RHS) protein [Trypanosoma rangeli]RNE97187.1 retrotransposon hot spot (RHS) protein [Trypanosoma rangeli]|eukprot:RNE97187.1 retrotransposon hot spot (RHS) protein [Trypanosoma rangeli]